jgi:hypothetical protein
MSQGTTGNGAFRFPYDFVEIAYEIRQKLHALGMGSDWDRIIDNFEALYMDRDRALEDYATNANRSTFVTVAGDGSGDFTTIKAAIESRATRSTNDGVDVIYVKPQSGGYLESGLGTITLPNACHIQLWNGALGDTGAASSAQTAWTLGQMIKTGTPHLSISGFLMSGLGVNPLVHSSSSGLAGVLQLENCQFNFPLYTTTTGKNFSTYVINDCQGSLIGGTWTESISWLIKDSGFQVGNVVSGLWSFTVSGASSQFVSILFDNCTLTIGGTNLWTGGYESNGTGRSASQVRFINCAFGAPFAANGMTVTRCNVQIQGCHVTNTENSADFGGIWSFIDCGLGANFNQTPTDEYGSCIIGNNNLPGVNLAFSYSTPPSATNRRPTTISGSYGSIDLGIDSCMVVVSMQGRNNSTPIINVSGNKNLILATFHRNAQMADGTPLTVSGDNNNITYTSSQYTGTHTDVGSGNVINNSASFILGMQLADAAGDLLVANGPDSFVRFPIGSDGQILTVDTAAATKTAWEDPAHFVYDAKGDLLIGTGDNTYMRLGIGLDQRLPRAEAATATGVSWDYQRTLNNRLTQNQASLETSTAGWTAESGCTIAQSAAQASHGANSLEITKS